MFHNGNVVIPDIFNPEPIFYFCSSKLQHFLNNNSVHLPSWDSMKFSSLCILSANVTQTKKNRFKLTFLKLPNPEMAIARVAARVAQGGHAVTEEIIRRRFVAGWRNFQQIYQPLVNAWVLYDNALDKPKFVDGEGGMNGQ